MTNEDMYTDHRLSHVRHGNKLGGSKEVKLSVILKCYLNILKI